MTTRTRTRAGEGRSEARESERRPSVMRSSEPDRSERADGGRGVGSGGPPLVRLQRAHGNRAVARLAEEEIRPKLEVGRPDDQYEREADRVAAQAVRTSASGAVDRPDAEGWTPRIRHHRPTGHVQRQGDERPSQSAEYEEAAKKTGEAFLKTELGRKLAKPAEELGEAFWESLAGKILTGVAVAGTVATLAATNEALPLQPPEIPLDAVTPGLSMNITYEGPARQPTKAFISFSYKFDAGGSEHRKPEPSAAERRRAETARMARELFEFRQSLKTPEQRAAEERILWEVVSRGRGPLGLPTIPGLEVVENPPPMQNLSPRATGREDEGTLWRKEEPVGRSRPVAAPGIVGEVLRSPGQPLDETTRGTMEVGFGHDFSEVRVHTDERAASSARAVGARAYAMGRDVVFGAGEYRPRTRAGRRLLAHELAHVVQVSRVSNERTVRRQEDEEERATPGTGGGVPPVSLLGGESTLRLDFDAELRRLLAAARASGDTATGPPLPALDLGVPSLTRPTPPVSNPSAPLVSSTLPARGRASGGPAGGGLPSAVTDLFGLENLRAVHYGGVNPNLVGSAVRSSSETGLVGPLSLVSERELRVGPRTVFGQPTEGIRFENYSGLRLSLGEFGLELGQNTVTATGKLGDLETQQIGRVRLRLGPAEVIYRNDHNFFQLVGLDVPPLPVIGELLGGGTDKAMTAALEVNLDLVDLDADPHLFENVFLEQVGLSMELNTGEPLQYGATASELPVYDRSLIRHPEVDRGELTATGLFRHRPSGVGVFLGAGVNSSWLRDTVQGNVHDAIDVPRFPVTPYLEFVANVGVSVPFE